MKLSKSKKFWNGTQPNKTAAANFRSVIKKANLICSMSKKKRRFFFSTPFSATHFNSASVMLASRCLCGSQTQLAARQQSGPTHFPPVGIPGRSPRWLLIFVPRIAGNFWIEIGSEYQTIWNGTRSNSSSQF